MKNGIKNGKPTILLIHHTAGHQCIGWSKQRVFESLNWCGYKKGFKRWGYNFYTGRSLLLNRKWPNLYRYYEKAIDRECTTHSFCMYHFAVFRKNKDEWEFLELIDNALFHDAGSTGNYKINQQSLAISFCGNYYKDNISDEAIKVAAKGLYPYYRARNRELKLMKHNQIDATACPGRVWDKMYILTKLWKKWDNEKNFCENDCNT